MQKKKGEMHNLNYGEILSKGQLEYVIQQCNLHGRNLQVMPDGRKMRIGIDETLKPIDCDVLVDLTPMNQILHVDQASKLVTVEPGITI